MGGIWGVVTHPKVRRKGYSRKLLTSLLKTIRESGKMVSCLYPFRESFYERLGYTTFPLPRKIQFSSSTLAPLLKTNLEGNVDIRLIDDGYEEYRNFLEEVRLATHGMALFDYGDRPRTQENKYWLALAKNNNEVIGMIVYNLKGDQVADLLLNAPFFYYKNGQGKYLLLEWLARHIDQATSVQLWLPAFETPETWLSDLTIHSESVTRAPMGRILDITGISGMSIGPGSFSAEIVDDFCPWNQGIWRFEAQDGNLQVTSTQKADCRITIQALSALVYGTHNPEDFKYRNWGNPPLETIKTMKIMFPRMLPHLHEFF
jgi:predicted acetyltransferase